MPRQKFSQTPKKSPLLIRYIAKVFLESNSAEILESTKSSDIVVQMKELTAEQQKTLIEIRRRKTELLLEIQHPLGVMFIKAGPGTGEEERRGSVSNWFSSLRRGGRRRREDTTVPSGYGSLGRRKDGTQARGKTRSAWDLTTVTRMHMKMFGLCTKPVHTKGPDEARCDASLHNVCFGRCTQHNLPSYSALAQLLCTQAF
ncbi:hypothetical protein RR46_14236 [Papilio xuthus]|uniref:Uncharacterized protein n=1 Tax=Papilio xuthus TaxID=66420 RepID=A0A194PPF3_PAPXU|nr:hypothetical protein RR46_14236 [Papilio xuthus]